MMTPSHSTNFAIAMHIAVAKKHGLMVDVLLELNLLGEKGEKKKPATAGFEPRVSDCSRYNH